LGLALDSPLPRDSGPSPRHRATSLVLAVSATLLMIVALLTLNDATPQRPRFRGDPIMLDLKPDAEAPAAAPKQAVSKPQSAPARAAPPPKPPPVPPLPQVPATHPYYIPLTQEENQAADISKIRPAGRPEGAQQQASAAGDSRPVGTAPDGQPLYDAQWYRRPTHAELSFYLPPRMPSEGWGLVACRTIAHYHVDDCVELGSSPAGSHLASVVRQAAWQFLVRPPRLGGRDLVGTWVRIRIDYEAKASASEAGESSVQP
jgi:protein TonB